MPAMADSLDVLSSDGRSVRYNRGYGTSQSNWTWTNGYEHQASYPFRPLPQDDSYPASQFHPDEAHYESRGSNGQGRRPDRDVEETQ